MPLMPYKRPCADGRWNFHFKNSKVPKVHLALKTCAKCSRSGPPTIVFLKHVYTSHVSICSLKAKGRNCLFADGPPSGENAAESKETVKAQKSESSNPDEETSPTSVNTDSSTASTSTASTSTGPSSGNEGQSQTESETFVESLKDTGLKGIKTLLAARQTGWNQYANTYCREASVIGYKRAKAGCGGLLTVEMV